MLAETATAVSGLGKSMTREWQQGNTAFAGYNTTRLLFSIGHVLTAWLLLRQAEVASVAIERARNGDEADFYRAKVATARWFLLQTLPTVAAEVSSASLIGGRHADWALL
jgi:hypothetical protein